ncbi:MAG: winged helix-turn-helix domain-containing protein [Nanoarchaeota archaeon]|jgi:predicted transcriptional regulator|nr:winged helix-turn-helix domain-containing protein [Nanoarchaeota archaeon]
MTTKILLQNEKLFSKIKIVSNRFRFKILELTQDESLSISKLGSTLKLAYTKCADYVSMLEKEGLIEKTKDGKEVLVRSKVKIKEGQVIF